MALKHSGPPWKRSRVTMPWACLQVLQPAIQLAEQGFPVSPVTAHYWDLCLFQIERQGGPGAQAFYAAGGGAPKAGHKQTNPDLAQTFRSLAANGALEGLSF